MARLWTILSLFVCIQIATGVLTNVALNKPANISSRLGEQELPPGGAVDGNITTTYATGIIHTAHRQNSAWWTVDLQTEVQDATVKIYFRTDTATSRRNGVKLYTSTAPFSTYPSGQLCHTFNGSSIPDVGSVTCTGTWRYLMVYTNTKSKGDGAILQFGEVEVWVCSDGTYGRNCDKSCSSRQCVVIPTSCDRYTGACPAGGCKAGYRGTDCTQICSDETYGTNCDKSCSSRQCAVTTTSCDRYTGACPAGGCKAGYRGTDCAQVCLSGSYGPGCTSLCTDRKCSTSSSASCHHVTGECDQRCQPGWREIDCTRVCPSGTYGVGCASTCGNCTGDYACHHVTGNCPGACRPGWRGSQCKQICLSGQYGANCEENCAQCIGTCDVVDGHCPGGCVDGYCGSRCNKKLEDPVTIAVTAAVAFVLMFVVVGGTLFCLIRSGRLKWVKAAEESTEMDDITNTQVTSKTESERPQSGSRHVYNNDYAELDVEAKPDNTEYEAIKRRHYENT